MRGLGIASVVAAVGALLIPTGARALPHPTVTWGLSGGTIMDLVETATGPQTGSDGYFFRENVVDFDLLDPFATSWTSSDPYYAGTYYWHVQYHGDYTAGYAYGPYWSDVRSFTVPLEHTVTSLRVQRWPYLREVDLEIRYTSNARSIVVTAALIRQGRTIWQRSASDDPGVTSPRFFFGDGTSTARFEWHGRFKRAVRATLRVTLTGDRQTTARNYAVTLH